MAKKDQIQARQGLIDYLQEAGYPTLEILAMSDQEAGQTVEGIKEDIREMARLEIEQF